MISVRGNGHPFTLEITPTISFMIFYFKYPDTSLAILFEKPFLTRVVDLMATLIEMIELGDRI